MHSKHPRAHTHTRTHVHTSTNARMHARTTTLHANTKARVRCKAFHSVPLMQQQQQQPNSNVHKYTLYGTRWLGHGRNALVVLVSRFPDGGNLQTQTQTHTQTARVYLFDQIHPSRRMLPSWRTACCVPFTQTHMRHIDGSADVRTSGQAICGRAMTFAEFCPMSRSISSVVALPHSRQPPTIVQRCALRKAATRALICVCID